MPTDSSRIECTLHNDSRLMAAIGTVICLCAERAGLPETLREGLAAAVVESCLKTFQLANGCREQPTITLAATDFGDRVQVTIEYAGGSPAEAPPFCCGKGAAEMIAGAPANASIDTMEYETCGELSRVTLIKYCGSRRHKPLA